MAEYPQKLTEHAAAVTKWEKDSAEGKPPGKAKKRAAPAKPEGPGSRWIPGGLYNAMIAPLVPYGLRGVLWYQGEANASRHAEYASLFTGLIQQWRKDFGQPLPFYFVQLANFESGAGKTGNVWSSLREAQAQALKLPDTGMAVTIDVGDPKDIHPVWKKPVGFRLSLAARALAYGQEIHYSGPVYREMEVMDDKIILTFDHIGEGLFAGALRPDDARAFGLENQTVLKYNADKGLIVAPLVGFSIAGEDRKFVWAKAEVVGDQVVVSSPEVPEPVAERYGWADYPVVNLYCAPGLGEPDLPASPFRTDDWQ
jgi:sialate O-acetylesterase